MPRSEIKVKVVDRTDKPKFVFRWKDPVTGRWRERISKIATSKNARIHQQNRGKAERAASDLQEELTKPSAKLGPTSWALFQIRYGSEHMPSLSLNSQEQWITTKNHVTEIINPAELADIDASAISLLAATLRKGNASENTIKSYLSTLRPALRWAVKMGLLAEVPAFSMPRRAKGKTKRRRARPITGEEFERMLAVAEQTREFDKEAIKSYLSGLWWSGLRLEESLALSWDWDAPFSVVFKDGRHPFFRITSEAQKGNEDQLLPIAPEFVAMLEKTPKIKRFGLVFDLGLASRTVSRIISDIGKKAGVKVNQNGKTATAHDFRRSFGTRWATRLAPAALKALMRHSSIETTMEFYIEIENDDLAKMLWAHAPKQENGQQGDFSGDPLEAKNSQGAT